jgi:uncharacterized protein (DUF2062 family)
MWKRLWSRIWTPILDQLKQGLTPSQAALAVAPGAYIGVFPLLGLSSLLCALVVAMLGLNQPVSQAVTWALLPLQLVLLFPFYEMGAWAFGGPYMTLSPKQFFSQVAADPMGVINEYWWIGWHGVAVWAVFGLVLVPLLWATFRFAFTKAASRLYRS